LNIGKDKIIATAVELFHEKGYSATTVQDIANSLNVTKAALYYYIHSKEEILWEIFDKTMNTAEKRIEELLKRDMSVEKSIRALIHNHIMNVRDEAPYMSIFFTERVHLPLEKQEEIYFRLQTYEKKITFIFHKGISEGALKSLPVLPTVYGILGMCNWMYQWYDPKGKLSPEEMAQYYAEIILNGILK